MSRMGNVEDVQFRSREEPRYRVLIDYLKTREALPESHLERMTTLPSSVLANDLFLPWDPMARQHQYREYTEDNWLAGRLIELLLFYDVVTIPTVDFAIVPPLVHWLGPPLYSDMLRDGRLQFVRYHGALLYGGNGAGLNLFEIHPSPENPTDHWWQRVARCEVEEAVQLQLKNRLNGLAPVLIDSLAQLTRLETIETAMPEFIARVDKESLEDIKSSSLRALFPAGSNFRHLPGIDANQARVYSHYRTEETPNDLIDLALRLGMMNLEAYLAEESGARDMVTDRGFSDVLTAKAERLKSGHVAGKAFTKLLTIEKLPDIVSLIQSKHIPADVAFRFSQEGPSRNFREWFDKHGPTEPESMVQEYVTALRDKGFFASWPVRLARFIAVESASFVLPVPGLAAGVIDNFLIEKIRLGYNPRYFVDSYRDRLLKGTDPSIPAPTSKRAESGRHSTTTRSDT